LSALRAGLAVEVVMVHRIEIAYKKGVRDARGEWVREGALGFLGIPLASVETRTVFKILGDLSPEEAERVAAEFTDEVIQTGSTSPPPIEPFDWVITVGFRPGVTDNVGRSARASIGDITGRAPGEKDAVFTETLYILRGEGVTREQAERIGRDLLANELIERVGVRSRAEWESAGPDLSVPVIEGEPVSAVREIDLDVSDEELVRISSEGILSLSLEEMRIIRDHFRGVGDDPARRERGLGPRPTDAELECLAQTWSEHCKHKIFNAEIEYTDEGGAVETVRSLFESCIRRATEEIGREKDWLVSVFHDNAGVIRFNDRTNLVFKVETHNSPSALDPYGGAITGIVGVNRDPFGTGRGAALLINVWGYCLGSPFYDGEIPAGLLHPRRIRDGVHKGVIDGGNQSGIPYGVGWEVFDDRYIGKPLVYCGTVGLMPREIAGKPSHVKEAAPGDHVVMVGGRIGKDGIHGATFSSEELRSESPAQAVQIGDPITQKKMTDFLLEARDRELYTCITDNGAGGLSSSVGEMCRLTGGATIDLARAPLKYQGLRPWEVLLSEAQERMTVGVPPDCLEAFLDLSARRDVESTVIGTFNDSGNFEVTWDGKTVAFLDLAFLHEGLPPMRLKAVWKPPRPPEPPGRGERPPGPELLGLLGSLNICSIEKKARQYDHEVKGLSVLKPFSGPERDVPSPATVFLAEYDSCEGIVLSSGINPSFSDVDTFHMMASVIDEAVRRIVAVGGDPDRIAGLDNFCWPDPVLSEKTPDGPYKLAQLVRANRGLYETTRAFGVPCISGKDSMKNDSTRGGRKISIPPTVLFSAVGKMEDVRTAVTPECKSAGDLVYVAGETRDELGGSEYFRALAERAGDKTAVGSRVPVVDPTAALALYRAVHRAIQKDLVRSCTTPSKGGLGVVLALAAAGGRTGLAADLSKVPGAGDHPDDVLLFSESNSRFVITVAAEDEEAFVEALAGFPCRAIGRVTDDRVLSLTRGDRDVLRIPVEELLAAFKGTLAAV
jgi:phosphoribosylformylglycinamidine synthase